MTRMTGAGLGAELLKLEVGGGVLTLACASGCTQVLDDPKQDSGRETAQEALKGRV